MASSLLLLFSTIFALSAGQYCTVPPPPVDELGKWASKVLAWKPITSEVVDNATIYTLQCEGAESSTLIQMGAGLNPIELWHITTFKCDPRLGDRWLFDMNWSWLKQATCVYHMDQFTDCTFELQSTFMTTTVATAKIRHYQSFECPPGYYLTRPGYHNLTYMNCRVNGYMETNEGIIGYPTVACLPLDRTVRTTTVLPITTTTIATTTKPTTIATTTKPTTIATTTKPTTIATTTKPTTKPTTKITTTTIKPDTKVAANLLVSVNYYYNYGKGVHAFCASNACITSIQNNGIGYDMNNGKGLLGKAVNNANMASVRNSCPTGSRDLKYLGFTKVNQHYEHNLSGVGLVQGWVAVRNGACGATKPIKMWKSRYSDDWMYGVDMEWNTWYKGMAMDSGKVQFFMFE